MKGLVLCLVLVATVCAQEGNGYSDDDMQASASANSKTKSGSSNYQNLAQQSLFNDDSDRNGYSNRDGSSSGSYSSDSGSSYNSYSNGNDYGYGSGVAADSSHGYGGASYGGDDKLGGFVHALTAFLPIGLFLAAIVPNIITINTGRRRRSDDAPEAGEDVTFPILDMISSYGFRSLQEPTCQSKITCELGRMGGLPEANTIQRAIWFGANFIPDRVARLLGLDNVVMSIRKRQCDNFACGSHN